MVEKEKTGISAADTANYSNCDRLNAVDSDTDKVGYYFDPASTDIIINSPYSGLAEFKNWLEGTVFELPYATPYVEDITSKMSKKFLTVVKGGGLSLETSFDIVHEGYDIPNSIKYLVYYPKGETL